MSYFVYSSTFWLFYVIVHILTYLLHKYYFLRNEFNHKNNAELNKKFLPFVRPDLDAIHVIWSMPFYIFFLPKCLLGWTNAFVLGAWCLIIGKADSPLKKFLLEWPIRYVCWVTELLAGIIWVQQEDLL